MMEGQAEKGADAADDGAKTPLRMTLRPYDQFAPLLLGDVDLPDVAAHFDWNAPLTIRFPEDLDAAEVSFNRYVLSRARGEDDPIGIPAYVLRGFRHRNFFVRRDSDLKSLGQLKGRRLATNSWSDSGTLWARAAMREAGVEVADVQWTVGQFDADTPSRPIHQGDLVPPESATRLAEGDTLMQALAEGRIDAITTAFAPPQVFERDGHVRRLVEDYPQQEADYHARCGIYPAFHIVAFRRSYALEHPQAVLTLCAALRRSWDIWWLKAQRFAEATPWAMADLERMARELADDTPPFGRESEGHRRMLAAICEEQAVQGLVTEAADPDRLFAGFDEILGMCGVTERDVFSGAANASLGGRP